MIKISKKSYSGVECLLALVIMPVLCGTFDVQSDFPLFAGAADVEKGPELDLSKIINYNVYSKIFVRKREEHKLLVNHFQSIDDYAKRYKLMKLGIDEVIRVIREEGGKLRGNRITADSEFPKIQELMNALAQFLENTCLFGEIVLHFPDMSYRMLKSVTDWRELLTQALTYTETFKQVLDDKSIELLNLLNQEINEDQRTADYVNPYRDQEQDPSDASKKKKGKTKPKKGPSLIPPKNEL
ncbi:coiled-coil domain-containing protein 134-like [Anopheles cruzii]|uniref:coiled-coil domain-containing protein 134-like n=1 Tax=Anopheles cruzii TaxID=68878 RepID=UPI0022EC5891|nr:coiled-coil domain-containing protein 134-like [Anopheles cruzii]